MANRRNILIGGGVVVVAAAAGAAWYFTRPGDPLSTPIEGATGGGAPEGSVQTTALMSPAGVRDKVLGNADAKVTVIEYASPTCPHCAAFSNDVRPAFEAKYVETGKVKFIVRPFTRNNVDAAIFLLAEAAANAANGTPATPAADTSSAAAAAAPAGYSEEAVAAYHNVINTYFKTQPTWAVATDSYTALLNVATQLGFSKEMFDATLKDSKAVAPLEAARDQALNEFGLTGTPTFYINGKALSGEKTLDALSAEIDPLL